MAIRSRKVIARGSRLRVLVVDDSVVIRRLVTHALSEDPTLEVVGSASNGAIALARIPQLNPDVITLDIEMPEMGGLETLRRLRRTYKEIRVIMFSTLTERGAAITMEALTLGADDYVAKASNTGALSESMASLREDLIPKIKQFFVLPDSASKARAPVNGTSPVAIPVAPAPPLARSLTAPKVVAIGVSTGGPAALSEIIPHFPAGFPLPVLIVQHMPALFTRLLAERLQGSSALKVEEASEGALIQPGKVLIAPGNFHMRVARKGTQMVVALDQGPLENSCRPAVDVLFRSVNEAYSGAAIAVILTGMGCDGARGAGVLKASGAKVIAQDEASSVVWGMPGAVVQAGLADDVVPLDGILRAIVRSMGSPA